MATARRSVRRGNPTSARERALRALYDKILPEGQVTDSWVEGFPDEGSGAYENVPALTTDQHVTEPHTEIAGDTTHVDMELMPLDPSDTSN